MPPSTDKIKGLLYGIAVGDALGVPVEFMSRAHLQSKPVTGFDAVYFNDENRGIWSDDSSLTFCLVESMIEDFEIENIALKIKDWYIKNLWSASHAPLEVGLATRNAIDRLDKGISPYQSGENGEYSNGNGALMRIAPLAIWLAEASIQERYETTKNVAAITHAHIRNAVACFFLVEFLQNLLVESDKCRAFEITQNTVRDYINSTSCNNDEKALFLRIFYDDISMLAEDEVFSTAYVIHTLEAAIWAFLSTNSYEEAVLKAINLGHDTDTTGSVTGALAGIFYGYKNIPSTWAQQIVKQKDIENLAMRFEQKLLTTAI
jgi:ADP-ribosyl-[dinitrogen reductase] hydrolase